MTLDLPIRALPASLIGARLVQLSDIHVGPHVDDAYVIDTFRQVEALAPDIVAYTGDLVSHHRQGFFPHIERIYAAPPRGRLATIGIPGNHEYGPGWSHAEIADRVVAIAEAGGIRMLRQPALYRGPVRPGRWPRDVHQPGRGPRLPGPAQRAARSHGLHPAAGIAMRRARWAAVRF